MESTGLIARFKAVADLTSAKNHQPEQSIVRSNTLVAAYGQLDIAAEALIIP